MRKFFASVLETVEIAAIAITAVFLIRSFLVQPFLVSGASMVPNFADGDYLLIDELTYRVRPPMRGEVAVFRYPNDESTFFIKRIVGLPSERVIVKNEEITIINKSHPEGFTLREEYLGGSAVTKGFYDVTLQDGEYYVLGDNRPYSFDSRSWGSLRKEEIVGLVRLRLWPPKGVTVFAAPTY